MIAVIFEVWPVENRAKTYFDLAAELRPLLEEIEGFISIERFESLATKGKYLSLSFWRDEESIQTWMSIEQLRKKDGVAYSRNTGYGLHPSCETMDPTSAMRLLEIAVPHTANSLLYGAMRLPALFTIFLLIFSILCASGTV
jgi:heme-degrading monooxygenase HmoA